MAYGKRCCADVFITTVRKTLRITGKMTNRVIYFIIDQSVNRRLFGNNNAVLYFQRQLFMTAVTNHTIFRYLSFVLKSCPELLGSSKSRFSNLVIDVSTDLTVYFLTV